MILNGLSVALIKVEKTPAHRAVNLLNSPYRSELAVANSIGMEFPESKESYAHSITGRISRK
jgi:hypothetical protein